MSPFLLLFAAAAIQAATPPPTAAEEEAALVEDPFAIEEEEEEAAPDVASDETVRQAAAPSRHRLICRSRPELNTRTRFRRVCMTAEQWEVHGTHMEQQRRDINDWGNQGGPGSGPG